MSDNLKRGGSGLAGLTVFTCLLVAGTGFIIAIFAAASHDYADAGVCLAASGLASGLLANAVFRD